MDLFGQDVSINVGDDANTQLYALQTQMYQQQLKLERIRDYFQIGAAIVTIIVGMTVLIKKL